MEESGFNHQVIDHQSIDQMCEPTQQDWESTSSIWISINGQAKRWALIWTLKGRNTLNDPLSAFRGTNPAPAYVASAGRPGKRTYEAYDEQGRPCPYTEILCVMQPSQAPLFRSFLAAIFNADFEDVCTLVYTFMAVEIRGRNLKEMRQAIQSGRCEFIQEYHEQVFLPPGKDEPVIESIRFITGKNLTIS